MVFASLVGYLDQFIPNLILLVACPPSVFSPKHFSCPLKRLFPLQVSLQVVFRLGGMFMASFVSPGEAFRVNRQDRFKFGGWRPNTWTVVPP